MKNRITLLAFIMTVILTSCFSQYTVMDAVPSQVNFDEVIRPWDGFGFNYVETAQAIDYNVDAQEYGGFSLLSEADQDKVLDMVFGEDGLKPGLVKMFLDPFHQEEPGGPFNHSWSQNYMINFVKDGLDITRNRGADLSIITTLYGPPSWATKQKFMRGRDLDPKHKEDLADYISDWVNYLRTEEELPVDYASIHNEGEDWNRWPADGKSGNIGEGHDYNLYWPPEQVAEFLPILRKSLDSYNLEDVGVTPGETSNWFRFYYWGFAEAIADNPDAISSLGLITSHGFYSGNYGRWFGEHNSVGNDVIREIKPDMHSWVTSTSWSKMDAAFIKEMHGNIYTSKVNGIIPWAGIQRPAKWVGGDPNPGCAFRVSEDGTLEVMRGYYFYKQISRAGQPGMGVAQAFSQNSEFVTIAFSSNGTTHPDAFLVINLSDKPMKGAIEITGTQAKKFEAFRTDADKDRYTAVGEFKLKSDGVIYYDAPAGSVTTFFAK